MLAKDGVPLLLKIVAQLKEQYPHKEFTLDGRLVGDLGEVLAEESYDLKLFDKVEPFYDGTDALGRKVQIKATLKKSLGFPCSIDEVPELYLGLKINEDGSFDEIFNGPGLYIWEIVKNRKVPKNNLFSIGIAALSKLSGNMSDSKKVSRRTR